MAQRCRCEANCFDPDGCFDWGHPEDGACCGNCLNRKKATKGNPTVMSNYDVKCWQIGDCHPACACREKKVEELVEAADHYFPVNVPHHQICGKCSLDDHAPCTCGADRLTAAIEGVTS